MEVRAPMILNLGTRMWVISFTDRRFFRGK